MVARRVDRFFFVRRLRNHAQNRASARRGLPSEQKFKQARAQGWRAVKHGDESFGVVEAPRALVLSADAKRVSAPADPPELRDDDGVAHRWARSRAAAKTGSTFPARSSSTSILKPRLGLAPKPLRAAALRTNDRGERDVEGCERPQSLPYRPIGARATRCPARDV